MFSVHFIDLVNYFSLFFWIFRVDRPSSVSTPPTPSRDPGRLGVRRVPCPTALSSSKERHVIESWLDVCSKERNSYDTGCLHVNFETTWVRSLDPPYLSNGLVPNRWRPLRGLISSKNRQEGDPQSPPGPGRFQYQGVTRPFLMNRRQSYLVFINDSGMTHGPCYDPRSLCPHLSTWFEGRGSSLSTDN